MCPSIALTGFPYAFKFTQFITFPHFLSTCLLDLCARYFHLQVSDSNVDKQKSVFIYTIYKCTMSQEKRKNNIKMAVMQLKKIWL